MKHSKKQTKNAGKARKSPRSAPVAVAPKETRTRERDPRLPAPGTVLTRPYKGKDYRVTVLEDGFRYDGREFSSLSKLASEITGQASINGFLWMRLTGGGATPTTKGKLPKSKEKPARAEGLAQDPAPAEGSAAS